jgi:hypothetical protein
MGARTRLLEDSEAIRVWHTQLVEQLVFRQWFVVLGKRPAIQAGLEASAGLLERLDPGAAHGHGLTNGTHHGGELGLAAWELLEGESGHLGDDVVDAGLKGCRCFPTLHGDNQPILHLPVFALTVFRACSSADAVQLLVFTTEEICQHRGNTPHHKSLDKPVSLLGTNLLDGIVKNLIMMHEGVGWLVAMS